MVYVSETQSSLLHLVLIFGIGLLLPVFVDPKKTLHRSIMLGIAIILAVRYIWWRATETIAPLGLTVDFAASWSLLGLEIGALIGSVSAFVILSRTRDRSAEVEKNLGWWGSNPAPKVAILIATYNEELEMLERTITGSKGLRHPNTTTYVLDDGRRDWLRDYCLQRDVQYVRRPDNLDAKAGNINHALKLMAADPPDFVAVLDADFVPHRGFISRTLALFHDPGVGLVQTPQHFFNADPIQHNLNMLSRGNVVPIINDVSQLIGAIPITRAAIVGLLKPVGHPFKVTAKGGERSKIQVQWRMMAPFAALFALTVVALMIGIFTDYFAFYDAGEGKAVVLFWTIYNLFVLFFTIILCIELPRKERHVADAPEQATLLGDKPQRVWMTGLTATNVRLRGANAPNGAFVNLRIDGIGELMAAVMAQTEDGVRVQLLPTAAQAERLQLRFYAEDNVPGIAGAKLGGVLRGLGLRLAFSAGR